jgi:hypothetical protein
MNARYGFFLALLLAPLGLACSDDDERDGGTNTPTDSGFADLGTSDVGPVDQGLDGGGPEDTGLTEDTGFLIPDGGAGGDVGPSDGGNGGPIVAPDHEWTWVPVPGSRCINNSETGFGVNLDAASTKLVIFMNGGNACFNVGSCLVTANVDGYGQAKFDREKAGLNGAAFDRTANENYFRDWSYVYLPYCSGDVFAGTKGTTTLEGSTYTFQGYTNVGLFLERIVPTFPNVTEVMLTGVSAGGFGAFTNYDQVATAFGPNVKVTLIDDSGPPMNASFVPACLQAHFANTWGLNDGPLAACGPACTASADGTFMVPFLEYMLTKYPDRNFGLISSAQDSTIRTFWGYGNNNCSMLSPGFQPPAYTGPRFQMGLIDLRDNVFSAHNNAKLYMPNGTRHVWQNSPTWTINENGVVLQDWIRQAIEDDAAWTHAPVP